MAIVRIPYGKQTRSITLPDGVNTQILTPHETPGAADPGRLVEEALVTPLGAVSLVALASRAGSVAIAINDKTRPVPHDQLLPPLLAQLESAGVPPSAITLMIATGTHPPMAEEEYATVVPAPILARYPVLCHDAAQTELLCDIGVTTRGTPVRINRHFAEADLRLVVGNIEPHQFVGFSGGVKTAVIGLGGRDTITANHSMMSDPNAQIGEYTSNPVRQDIEEAGELIGIHFALNAILNGQKQIVQALAGSPTAVMLAGVPLVRQISQVVVDEPFDLLIVSPGGHPKDINIYQAQKALGHAALVARTGGEVILLAACPEGTGSRSYEEWILSPGMDSLEKVLTRFREEGFRIGPHKAFQLARDASRVRVSLLSELSEAFVRRLLLEPISDLDVAVLSAVARLAPGARIGIMPRANATIPRLRAPRSN